MNSQEYKTRPQDINGNGDEPVFFHLLSRQVNVVAVLMQKSICKNLCS